MSTTHAYDVTVRWTGAGDAGTADYRAYGRDHEVRAPGRPPLQASSDPAFRGDATRWNPELLLVASLSECHLLWYLHLCAVGGVVVVSYVDRAAGTMVEDGDRGGRFAEVVLRPQVEVAEPGMAERALALHPEASARCFIAASVNFPVRHEPAVAVADPAAVR